MAERIAGEGEELLDPHDRDVLDPGGVARLDQLIGHLARAQHEAADLFVRDCARVGKDAAELLVTDKIGLAAARHRMAQQRLGAHDDQRLPEIAQHLPAQHVEVVGRRGDVAHAHIVIGAQLEEALEPRRGVLRPLALVTVRQEHHEAIGAQPLALAAGDELIDHDLRAIGKVAELAFPQHQALGIGHGIAIFKAEHAIFGQRAVVHLEAAMRQGGERHIFALGLLIHPHRVALREGAAARILARKPHPEALHHQAAEGERLGGGPVEALAGGKHLALGGKHALEGLVDLEVGGDFGEHPAERVDHLGFDPGLDAAARGLGVGGLVEPGPAPAEPVGLVGLVGLAGLELGIEQLDELGCDRLTRTRRHHALADQPLLIDYADLGVLADLVIHQRLGELGLITLVVAEAAIAPHVDHHVAVEGLAIFDRELAGEGHRLGIVAIDVEDRRHHALGHIAGIGRGAREFRRSGEADLVVNDEVDATAGVIARHAREREAFPHHALPGKGGIAVDQHREHLALGLEIITDGLLRTGLAEHHRIDRLEVRGIGHQAHVHADPVKLTIGRGAEVILDVA
ncbi:MAG: hypothetical protein KatS3mg120_2079 [Erythrobacter sp.]|nr:MAG: hypothetical protein KatS3mg120_2079 [Erythrobacter sp.]